MASVFLVALILALTESGEASNSENNTVTVAVEVKENEWNIVIFVSLRELDLQFYEIVMKMWNGIRQRFGHSFSSSYEKNEKRPF